MDRIGCIICMETKESSVEHIIPKAMGNQTLIINAVCRDCNSKMGETIDGPFVNNDWIDMHRHRLNLKGHKGHVPHPLREGIDEEGNKIRLNRKFKPRLVPEVKDYGDYFTISAGSKKEARQIGLKKLKRGGAAEERIKEFLQEINEAKVRKVYPKINYRAEVNLQDIYLGILKIAYEYMYLLAGDDYLSDLIAKKIRRILNDRMNNKAVETDGLILTLSREIGEKLQGMDQYHWLVPVITESNEFLLAVILFNGALPYTVLISKNSKKYQNVEMIPRVISVEN